MPARGRPIQCSLCRACLAKVRAGDTELRTLVELRLLINFGNSEV